MHEKDESAGEPSERWFVTVRIETPGPRTVGRRGSSRRMGRALSDTEAASLVERLRSATEEYLEEIGALAPDDADDWVEALADGSWGWRIGS